ncbi:MAG: flavin reductase family protein [Myxococcales bacterium]|nr:flavin reductase family protein [Myxococcales bacterium]
MSTQELPADSLRASDAYRLMISLVAPRPIAWVSTLDRAGRGNIAPYSYFQAVCSSPPTIVLGIGSRPDGTAKDTLANILDRREFVVNHVSEPFAEVMNASSAPYEPGVSEWEALGIEPEASTAVAPPRVRGARASLECRLQQAIPLGQGPNGAPSSTLVIARVVHFHLAEGLLERDERGRLKAIDPARLAAVGRLGGIAYTTTAGRFDLPRPPAPPPARDRE